MAVVRSIVAKMAAETSNWEAGMARASRSLSSVNDRVLDFKEEMAEASTLMEVAGKGFVYTSATTERLAAENKQAAWAADAHARQAKHLTSVIEELAAAEKASIPIINEVASARKAAAASGGGGGQFGSDAFGGALVNAKGVGTLLKMGGALAVVKIGLREATQAAEKFNDTIFKFRTNTFEDDDIKILELMKSTPWIGMFTEAGEAWGRASREAYTGELAHNQLYQTMMDDQVVFMDNMKKEQEKKETGREGRCRVHSQLSSQAERKGQS